MEEVADASCVFPSDTEVFAHFLVIKFGEGFGSFYAESMKVEIPCVVAGIEERFSEFRCAVADCNQRESDDVVLSVGSRLEEI